MNKNSNSYIIMYSTIMVIVVAAVLSFAALSLKGRQSANVRIEKMSDILRSIGQGGDADNAANKEAYITEMYDKYITDSYAVDVEGKKLEGVDAFSVLINLQAEYNKEPDQRQLPIFVGEDNGTKTYVVPVWGTGLWGPVWGYLALEGDWNTISGVVFDHKSETPGLGAEITTPMFMDQFVGKQIFSGTQMVGVSVVKGGAPEGSKSAVDAISGGTLTSRGVEDMIIDCLSDYEAYFKTQLSTVTSQLIEPSQNELSTSEQSANNK